LPAKLQYKGAKQSYQNKKRRPEKKRIALLFGSGGLYDSEELHVREAMLQQLESSIQLMHQELEMLLREILIRQALEEKANGRDPQRLESSLAVY